MTSVAREGVSAGAERMAEVVADRFVRHFGYRAWRALPADRFAAEPGACA
jgi:hypothetical protein